MEGESIYEVDSGDGLGGKGASHFRFHPRWLVAGEPMDHGSHKKQM